MIAINITWLLGIWNADLDNEWMQGCGGMQYYEQTISSGPATNDTGMQEEDTSRSSEYAEDLGMSTLDFILVLIRDQAEEAEGTRINADMDFVCRVAEEDSKIWLRSGRAWKGCCLAGVTV